MSDPAPHGSGPLMPEKAPVTETLRLPGTAVTDDVPRLPLALRLIGRSSLPGAAFVIAFAAAFVVGLPWIAGRLAEDAPVTPSETTLSIGPADGAQVQLTLAGDWAEESRTDGSVVLTNAGAELSLVAPQPVAATGTPQQVIERAIADLAGDVDAAWVASDPIELTTDVGDPGLCITGSTVTDIAMTCAVEHGSLVSTLTAHASTQVWPSLQAGVDSMVKSLTFTGAGT